MTAQEIFDKAVGALLAQKERSWDKDLEKCVYRTDCGLKCAVGHLIPDQMYCSSMEVGSSGVCTLLKRYPELEGVILPSDLGEAEGLQFLIELQAIHDNAPDWEVGFKQIASSYKLQWNFGEQHA